MLETCTLAVFGVMNNSAPISRLDLPLDSRRSTSRSRSVSPAVAPLAAALHDLARRARLDVGRDGHDSRDGRDGRGATAGLTDREREVLRLLSSGKSNREIGAELFITPKTASVHVSNILAKLGAASRTEAAAIAHREGV